MKKMILGIFALVLCLSSFKTNAQSDEQLNAYAAMYNSNVDLVNVIIAKTSGMTETNWSNYMASCRERIDAIQTSADLQNNTEYINDVAVQLGFSSYSDMSNMLKQFTDNQKAFAVSVGIDNPTEQQWQELFTQYDAAARLTDIRIKEINTLLQAPPDDPGNYSGPCKHPIQYAQCGVICLAGGQSCLWGCSSAIALCPPCAFACAIGCALAQTACIGLCAYNFCEH